jgi:hypothetical protein
LPDAPIRLKASEATRIRMSLDRNKRELELKLRDLI